MALRIMATFMLCGLVALAAPFAGAQEAPAPTPPAPTAGEPVEQPQVSTVQPDQVIARVGDHTITARSFERDVMMRWRMQGPASRNVQPDVNFRRRVLQELINARVLRILAKNSGIEVTQQEVQEEYDRGREQVPNDKAFEAYLESMGLTQETLMDELRDRVMVDKYRLQETADLKVEEEEVAALYNQLKAEGKAKRTSPTADVGQILIMPEAADEVAWEAAKAKAEAARQRIVDGEAFEDVANDVSLDLVSNKRGGLYREAVPGLVGPELSQQMMSLPIGELSEPFRSSVGWHIIKVYARYEPGEMSQETLAPAITERLLEQKRGEFFTKRIEEAKRIIRIEILPAEK